MSRSGRTIAFTERALRELEERWLEDPLTGCLEWQGPVQQQGYGLFHWMVDGVQYGMSAHAARARVLFREGQPLKANEVVHHDCFNVKCGSENHIRILDAEEHKEIHRNLAVLQRELRIAYLDSIKRAV